MHEVVVVPTYNRVEMLFACLWRIRAIEPHIDIHVFADRGSAKERPEIAQIAVKFNAYLNVVPKHNYYGNTFNTMEAFRAVFNQGYERVYYVEDDVFVHNDFFSWHRKMHEKYDDIFASMAWIFNREAEIVEQELFQPWYYSVGTCFARRPLLKVVEHASPLYYADMGKYILDNFPKNALNFPYDIAHYEQDGLIQRVLDDCKMQTVSPGIAKCSHIGFGGYNRGWNTYEGFFRGEKQFDKRVAMIEALYMDPYWRISLFGRPIVEREFGREIPKREIHYRVKLNGGWSTQFTSEMSRDHLPSRFRSVNIPGDAEVVVES
jgi:hypothetical protein